MPTAVVDDRAGRAIAERNDAAIRSLYAAFNRRDIEALLGHLTPDVRWYTLDLDLRPSVYKGRAQVGGFLGRTLGDLAEFRAEPERLVAEGETVMALIRFTGRRTSDLPGSSFRVAHVWTMRDGLATKHRFFLDPSKAERAFARSLVA